MQFKSFIRKLFLWLAFGKHVISENEYIKFLDKLGVRHGKNLFVTDPLRCEMDLTRPWLLEFGDDVTITDSVRILTHDFSYSVVSKIKDEVLPSFGKVSIGNNVFIGSHAIILPDSTIGDNVIIGAGSIVKGSVPSNSVVAGVPGRVVSSIDEMYDKLKRAYPNRINQFIKEYEAVYHRLPDESLMTEFYGLYMTYDEIMDKYPNYIKRLVRNSESVKPLFDSYESMIEYISKNAGFPQKAI